MDIVLPDGVGWIEIGVAFLTYFFLSFLWWGPIMGRKWGQEMGIDMDEKVPMAKPMILQIVASFLTIYVFWHVTSAFTVDLETDALSNPSIAAALTGAFFTWLGFFVPVQLGRVAWEKASWALFGINTGGYLLALGGASLVFALL